MSVLLADDGDSWFSGAYKSVTAGANYLVNSLKMDAAALSGAASAVGEGVVMHAKSLPSDIGAAVTNAAGTVGKAAAAVVTPLNKTLLIIAVVVLAVAVAAYFIKK